MFFDWPQFQASNTRMPVIVNPRRRLAICLAGFVAMSLAVFARAVQLEVTQGEAFRSVALRPIEKETVLPAARGRILARDGMVLAQDETVRAVAVEYRWFQEPPDPRWLRAMVHSRLSKTDRKNAEKVSAEQAGVLAERTELAGRLSKLCGLSRQQWAARTRRIQAQVERIADDVNRRRQSERDCPDFRANENGTVPFATRDAQDSWTVRLRRLLLEDPPQPQIVVAEELAPHVVAEDVPENVVTEIENHADHYPGARIVEVVRRTYPQGTLAAHVLGHLGPPDEKDIREYYDNLPSPFGRGTESHLPSPFGRGAGGEGEDGKKDVMPFSHCPHPNPLPKGEGTDEPGATVQLSPQQVGKMGVERQYEALLEGCPGLAVEQTDRSGRLVASSRPKEPIAGRDLTLTLDARLQRTAEDLLSSATKRGQNYFSGNNSSDPFLQGGCVVVMDVRSGAILAAASAPSFDPNVFVRDRMEERAALLADKSHPLFDRVCRMAIPPGSTFKTLTAVALLESSTVKPQERFACQGYLHDPDRQRCEIYVRRGIGHGEVDLADALAVSCNVYFFYFAEKMGPRPLVDWAERFGFGRPTGIDLPGEAAGTLPCPENICDLRRDCPNFRGHQSAAMVDENGTVPFTASWRTTDTQSMAIGQGSLTATPLQVLRLMGAVANGGKLVTPHVVKRVGEHVSGSALGGEPPSPREENDISNDGGAALRLNHPMTLQTIREGLLRVVADPKGTAHGTVFIESIAVAGKTGTAETGEDQASHAWFAGYAPADDPKLAFVVVLEHAGDAATAAGPVAKRLVLRMEQLGML